MAGIKPAPHDSVPTVLPTNEQLIETWLKTVYLNYTFEDRCECSLTMKEFLNIPNMVYPASWLGHTVMNTAIALLAKEYERSDVIVLSDILAQQLYYVGTKAYTTRDVSTGLENVPAIFMDEKKRWVVVPCTDGLLDTERIMAGYQGIRDVKKANSKAKGKPKGFKNVEEPPASGSTPEMDEHEYGNHWGLLIVDKEKKTALWLDSMIEVERSKDKKWKIKSMLGAGTVAGKVLRGIEAFLVKGLDGYEQDCRSFTARTLKSTPQQKRDNSSQDSGACGPFAFEILRQLFKQPPGAMEDIKALFPSSKRQHTKFNSEDTRKHMKISYK